MMPVRRLPKTTIFLSLFKQDQEQMNKTALTAHIKKTANELGFGLCGIAEATFLENEARYLEKWLNDRKHGTMQWMENHFEKRTDPRLLVEGARSVISVIHSYFPPENAVQTDNAPKISCYAWGEDYHRVLKRKLYQLQKSIEVHTGPLNARIFTDSAPVMDKVWAQRAGLGWIGKHTNLITPQKGSWYFIGEIITDLELNYDTPTGDFCGTCTKCIDSCPTGALSPYEIDSNKCISYLTIELKGNIEDSFQDKMDNWAYGCDVCQDVCPWNSFAKPDSSGEFKPLDHILKFSEKDWRALSRSKFSKLNRTSAMSRVKWDKFMNTLDFLAQRSEE